MPAPTPAASLYDHVISPRNAGRMESPDATGRASVNGRPPHFEIYLKLNGAIVEKAAFTVYGCGYWTAKVYDCREKSFTLTGGPGCWDQYPGLTSCQFPATVTLEPVMPSAVGGTSCANQQTCYKWRVDKPKVDNPACAFPNLCCCGHCCDDSAEPINPFPGGGGSSGNCGTGAGGGWEINPANGNLAVRLCLPDAGPMEPASKLQFNSNPVLQNSKGYGWGFTCWMGPHVQPWGDNGCDAFLYRCDGSVWCYSSLLSNGSYGYHTPGAPSSLTWTGNGWQEVQPPNGRCTTYTYNSSGLLVSVQNPCGQIWTVNSSSPVSNVVDPFGRRTTYLYDGSGNIQGIQDAFGRITSFVVDANGNLTQQTSPSLCITKLVYGTGYGNLHQLQAVVAPDGATTSFSYLYDSNNNVQATVNALGRTTTYLLDGTGKVTAVVNPLGQATSYQYDTSNRRIAVINALGNYSTTVYDALSQVSATVDALGNRTSYTYAFGQQTAVQDPLGNVSTTVYDQMNRVLAQVNPLGQATSYTYDSGCRPQAVINPLGYTSTTVYDVDSRPIASIDAMGSATSYAYDSRDNQVRRQDPLGNVSTTVFDAASRAVATINPLGQISTTVYDAASRVVASINPLGAT